MNDSIGLALSGGGFRAAAFHLGVLKRLEELGVLPQICRVSTVSGGSLTGALYALKCQQHGNGAPGAYSVEALISDMRSLLTSRFRYRALQGTWWRTIRTAASFARLGKRVSLVSRTIDDDLFGGAMLSEVPPWLQINATNMLTGKGWKFFHDAAGDYLIGATDKTDLIPLANAVTASAAFPGFVEALPFKTRWQDLKGDLLDDRWQKPPRDGDGNFSRWRSEFGHTRGDLVVPLTDGGLYDNEGLEGLRSSGVHHAIYSSTTVPDSPYKAWTRFGTAMRLVDILHSRMGALTRRLAHEMTHGTDPTGAKLELLNIASELDLRPDDESCEIARRIREIAEVGSPPRGVQYRTISPILLHRHDLAANVFADYEPAVAVQPEHRGLRPRLVDALSRVRTDLDSFDEYVIDLLVCQAYFLADAHLRLAVPKLLPRPMPPMWDWAVKKIADANANETSVAHELQCEAKRRVFIRQR